MVDLEKQKRVVVVVEDGDGDGEEEQGEGGGVLRFGKNMKRAGFGYCYVQTLVYFLLAMGAFLNFIVFAITRTHHYLYMAIAFIIIVGAYLGFFPKSMRRKFNIKKLISGLHFSNNTPFWNASAEALNDIRVGSKSEDGDRITALHQLVSPFGKTDTASVLQETIDYVKFLHDQVLSNSYLENGSPIQYQQGCDNVKDSEGPTQDLRSLGLCLVPISSTFPVTNETTIDFKTPTLVGAFNSS
ncbi:hypothetical protein TanjilG_13053 [Lupinus angustifolius]|uniref:BHLH domain-containing protein n=1 Tax=Lupinus angustifolius TaxID=3871 RepID=A0A1J7GP97_LUPAN|nr:hypothetical protein TanjilG_13053 [Lupinus angustifolius]